MCQVPAGLSWAFAQLGKHYLKNRKALSTPLITLYGTGTLYRPQPGQMPGKTIHYRTKPGEMSNPVMLKNETKHYIITSKHNTCQGLDRPRQNVIYYK